ncbi:MAG: DUF58 domain-containing protein, partial [Natronosporangium sp.]
MARTAERGWLPTRALHRAVGVGGLALLAGAALGQWELVLLAGPFLLGTALSLAVRPARQPSTTLTLDAPTSVEGGP